MAYASASDAAGYSANILAGASNFSTTSCPNVTMVNNWLSSGCSIIETRFLANKYAVPIAANSRIYDQLRNLNALYAAAQVELSRTNVVLTPGERTRGQVFDEMFWKELDKLFETDLSLAGVSRVAAGKVYAGGTKVSEKQTWENDTDRVKPRFSSGQFKYPDVLDPEGTTASQA